MPRKPSLRTQAPYVFSLRVFTEILVTGIGLYVVIAGLAGWRHSWQAAQQAQLPLLLAAVILIALSYLTAAETYRLLSPTYIPLKPILLVQISGGLVNRLLPAGLGGLGINAVYLRRRGNSLAVATTIVATNNMLGFVGNMLLLFCTVALSSLTLSQLAIPHIPETAALGGAAAALAAGIYFIKRHGLHHQTWRALREAGAYLRHAVSRPWYGLCALAMSCVVTALHVAALTLVVLALRAHITWPVALVAISAGAFAGAVVPTPGGLGAAEAGIAAVLIAFGIPAPVAVAAALVYRGITYWLPLLPGYLALRVVEMKYL